MTERVQLDLGDTQTIELEIGDQTISMRIADTVVAGGSALSDATPQPIGIAASGVSEDGSRADHVHAHGDQAGGSLHTNAVAAGAAGFMTGADKAKVDAVSGTNTGDQTITLTGDVTGSGTGSFAATIAADAVTFAKMQNVATDTLLGRVTSGTGDVETVPLTAAGRALIDDVDAAAQRSTLGLGTLATQSGTFSGTSSGTNTGDQTAGAGLTGTATLAVGANGDGSITVNADDIQVGVLATDAQHGVRGGGTQHANVVAAGAAGFMTGADKTKLDAVTGTNTGDQIITLTGDVTGAGTGSFAATIANDAVTLAKMANIATDMLIGRATSGTGDPETVACTAAGRALIDDTDASAQRTTLGLGTLATQSGTFSGTSSGTNTGDQTVTLTGDVTGSGTGSFTATIAADAVTNAKLADMNAHTFKGNNTGSPANPVDMTPTQATAELNTVVGDSGSGGTKGLVPAPASGDAAAGKVLSADGMWSAALAMLQDLEYFGDYSDGDFAPSSGTVTLSRDMFYRDFTPSGTALINTNGFIIRCRILDISNAPTSCIVGKVGGTGSNGSGASGGSAVLLNQAGFLAGSTSGVAGGASSTQGGNVQILSPGTTYIGSLGGVGGIGGANNAATAGGAGGSFSITVGGGQGFPSISANTLASANFHGEVWPGKGLTGTGGGGGRTGVTSGIGGGGGASGTASGAVAIFARTVIRGASTAAGCVTTVGGAGGSGAAGTTVVNQGGGGGGGGGGAGGNIILTYRFLSGATATNALQSVGGVGGTGGAAGGASAIGGTGGTGGSGGIVQLVCVHDGTITRAVGSAATAATVASTASATSGTSGTTAQLSL